MPVNHSVEESARSDAAGFRFQTPWAGRTGILAAIIAASAMAFLTPLRNLVTVSRASADYSYLLLIPVIVVGLFYLERRRIFGRLHYSVGLGALIMAAGIAVAGYGTTLATGPGATIRLFIEILGLAVIWIGAFVLSYGAATARTGIFALLCTLLFVPLPQAQMSGPIAFVQHASADITSFLFALFGVPVFRQGLTFNLTHLTFVVARECSGIHSTTALFICAIVAGHFYLKSNWQRVLLVLLIFPIVSFTNGLRMFILATLAVYVDMAFFFGRLHHEGGSLFFVLGLIIMALIVKLLRRGAGRRAEMRRRTTPLVAPSAAAGPEGLRSS